jgi:hypothetical protein
MPGIMPDHNIEGHFEVLLRILRTDPWREFWNELELEVASFASLGLSPDASDTVLWQACQQHDVLLVTANRNKDGLDSLEAAIAAQNEPHSLPVLTVSDAEQILTNREYAVRVVTRLLEFLSDLDNLRGTGRLYLP